MGRRDAKAGLGANLVLTVASSLVNVYFHNEFAC